MEDRDEPMPLTPVDWNVVVLGRWNRAILTPQGIITELFGQPEETKFGIEVPVDAIGPYKVLYDDLVVIADWNQLIVEAPKNNYESLARAMATAHKAIEALPMTPLSAAGCNVRYRIETKNEQPQPLLEASRHVWDGRFEDAGYPIAQRGLSRTVEWEGGKILVSLSCEQNGPVRLNINFERGGDQGAMKQWLQTPTEEIRAQVETICRKVLQLNPEVMP